MQRKPQQPSAADPLRMRHWLASYYPLWVNGEIIGGGNWEYPQTVETSVERILLC